MRVYEPTLTITPIVGWRQWLVTGRRVWEGRSGLVLRGLNGIGWEHSEISASCASITGARLASLEDVVSHGKTVPSLSCRCGIYAHKPGHGPSDGPSAPHVVGSVALEGVVIEGATGYRAEKARIDGPLELKLQCGFSGTAHCQTHPTVVCRNGPDVAPMCDLHQRFGAGVATPLDRWISEAQCDLGDRYGTPVIAFT